MEKWTVRRISHPWIVVGHESRVYQFATRKEAAAFAEAELAEWDEGMRDWYRRQAEEQEEACRWYRARNGDA